MLKVVFFSSDEFGVRSLTLLSEQFFVAAVVTTQDQPKGRGLKIQPNPIKQLALKLGIPIITPKNPNDEQTIEFLKKLKPEIGVLVAYGYILKKALLDLFPKGIINLHPSLLPKYRGPAPIQRTLMAGEKETGVTTFLLNEKIDAGEILLQKSIPISLEDNLGTLKERLAHIGAELLITTISQYLAGKIIKKPQDESLVTFAPKIKKEERYINWHNPCEKIFNQVRAFSPKPGALTTFRNHSLIILNSQRSDLTMPGEPEFDPGTLTIKNNQLFVKCGDGFLRIKQLKIEGKKAIPDSDFINGYRLKTGEKLGG